MVDPMRATLAENAGSIKAIFAATLTGGGMWAFAESVPTNVLEAMETPTYVLAFVSVMAAAFFGYLGKKGAETFERLAELPSKADWDTLTRAIRDLPQRDEFERLSENVDQCVSDIGRLKTDVAILTGRIEASDKVSSARIDALRDQLNGGKA